VGDSRFSSKNLVQVEELEEHDSEEDSHSKEEERMQEGDDALVVVRTLCIDRGVDYFDRTDLFEGTVENRSGLSRVLDRNFLEKKIPKLGLLPQMIHFPLSWAPKDSPSLDHLDHMQGMGHLYIEGEDMVPLYIEEGQGIASLDGRDNTDLFLCKQEQNMVPLWIEREDNRDNSDLAHMRWDMHPVAHQSMPDRTFLIQHEPFSGGGTEIDSFSPLSFSQQCLQY
jgi:hypothetical protein